VTALHPDRDRSTAARPIHWRALVPLLRAVVVIALAVLVTAGSYAAYCGAIIRAGNFHAVAPGVLYRAAQPSRDELDTFGRRYGIKSVLNLRGAHPGKAWYDDEIATSRDLGLIHYDFPLSAKRFVDATQIARLLAIIRRAPKPLLVHCESGADRSGLAAALYDYAIAGQSAAEAHRQLSLAYGHFPYLISRSRAMDASFWAFVGARAARR
jgi:protein tyrosine/serine phosphatase